AVWPADSAGPAVHIDLHALTGVRFQHDAGAVLVPFAGDVGTASHGLHVAASDGPDAGVDQQALGLGPRGAGAALLLVVGDDALPVHLLVVLTDRVRGQPHGHVDGLAGELHVRFAWQYAAILRDALGFDPLLRAFLERGEFLLQHLGGLVHRPRAGLH